jgi:hypothetical protein
LRVVEGVPLSFRVPSHGWEEHDGISVNKSIVASREALTS